MPRETGHGLPVFDLLTVDPRRHLLYVPHTSNFELDLVDTLTEKLAGTIQPLPGVRGVALTPDADVIFATESQSSAVAVVDTRAMKILATISMNGQPDAIAYDSLDDSMVVTSTSTKQLTIINRTSRKVTGTIDLPGTPELLTVDTSGVAYVAINDQNEVAAVTVARKSTALFRGCDITAPTGMALDDHGHLFVAGRAILSIVDILVDRCVGTVDIGSGVDQITVNTHLHHLYTANGGSRNLSVIDTNSFKPLGIVGTGPSGDGVATDPTTDLVYVMVGRPGIVSVYHDP